MQNNNAFVEIFTYNEKQLHKSHKFFLSTNRGHLIAIIQISKTAKASEKAFSSGWRCFFLLKNHLCKIVVKGSFLKPELQQLEIIPIITRISNIDQVDRQKKLLQVLVIHLVKAFNVATWSKSLWPLLMLIYVHFNCPSTRQCLPDNI